MQDSVAEVKSKIDIVTLISEYVSLKKAGRNFKAPCPFHSEKTPSFMVSPELQMYKCFGCSKSGDCFTFLQEYEGMEFYEALKLLAQKAGVALKPSKFDVGGKKERLYQVNSWAAYFYSYILLKHSAGSTALNYLVKERKLSLETIKTFGLGFSPESPFALKRFMVDKKKVGQKELQDAGIIYKKGSFEADRFRGRITFPLFDHRGNNLGFSGRTLPGKGSPELAKYINSPETDVYKKSGVLYGLNIVRGEIKEKGEAVVVEGELDMISSYQAGIKNTIAIKGSALTEDQAKLLSRFTKKIILALDSDFAGNEAARRGLGILERQGLEVRVATFPGFKDPDEAAHKDPDGLKKYLEQSQLVWDFVLNLIFEKHKSDLSFAQISKEISTFLATIEDAIVRSHYINLVAKKLGVPFEAVSGEVEKVFRKTQSATPSTKMVEESSRVSRRQLLEERFLSIALKKDPKILLDKRAANVISTQFAKRLLGELEKYFGKRAIFDLRAFSDWIPAELSPKFSEMVLGGAGVEEESGGVYDRELKLVERELEILRIKDSLKDLSDKIAKAEAQKDTKSLKKNQERFGKLSKKLSEFVEDNI